MKTLSTIFGTVILAIGTVAFSQYNYDNPDRVSGDFPEIRSSAATTMVLATTYSEPGINSFLELRRGVDEGIMEQEYENRIIAFGVSNDELGKMILISPNPVVDRFHLKIPGKIGKVTSAGIYDMEGTKVRGFGNRVTGEKEVEIEMDANDLVPGLYFVRIETEFGKISKSFTVR